MKELTVTDLINLMAHAEQVAKDNGMNRDAKFTNQHCEAAYHRALKIKYKCLHELDSRIDKLLAE